MHIPGSISSMAMGVQQHQPYPGLSSIPGMHPTGNSINPIHTMQSVPTIPGLQSFAHMSMPPLSNLMHSAPEPHNQSLSSSHLSNQFGSSGILSGGIEKKRRQTRKHRNATYGPLMTGEDAQTMMLAAQTHAAQTLSAHPEPTGATHSVPIYEADGIQFKILEQLPDTKINRLKTEKIKPIESLTFSDIKAYNRNQLRAYCSVYGIRRKKKAEMEKDMARYAALFHPGDPAYDYKKFLPTEYAEGPIPRRKVPVTKEQKEKAAGDVKRLTNALQQRPQATVLGQHHYSVTNNSHHALTNPHGLQHHPSNPITSVPRLHDIHGTHHSTAHSTQHLPSHPGQHENEDHAVVAASDLMSVPEMQVPNHLLQISHQIGEE